MHMLSVVVYAYVGDFLQNKLMPTAASRDGQKYTKFVYGC